MSENRRIVAGNRISMLLKKVQELRQKERVEFNVLMMGMKALIRTEGPSPNAIKGVREFAKKFGVL